MIREIFKKLEVKDLLSASEVCKFWRNVSSSIIADSVSMVITNDIPTKNMLKNLSVGYKHFIFKVNYVFFQIYSFDVKPTSKQNGTL